MRSAVRVSSVSPHTGSEDGVGKALCFGYLEGLRAVPMLLVCGEEDLFPMQVSRLREIDSSDILRGHVGLLFDKNSSSVGGKTKVDIAMVRIFGTAESDWGNKPIAGTN
uniref:Uncharacterized protein n=1 Tax=Palpitomonas bilix TaxID=652834 RepID=A0A7S3G4C4_9EUKA|mmetsp:Transcript_20804/g.53667  ORF Transcript_20804/g.53667 Transcript_20804/m.53667 type:complete len:109 (+) Transcript_20804:84-410(+)